MKITIIFLSILLCLTNYLHSIEIQKGVLTEQEVVFVLNELRRNKWHDQHWFTCVKEQASELTDKVNRDVTIKGEEIASLKKQLETAHIHEEKRSSFRCSVSLLVRILDHAQSIRAQCDNDYCIQATKNSSREKHVRFMLPQDVKERSEDAE